MLVRMVALQPQTRKNEFQHNIIRINSLFSHVAKKDKKISDATVMVLPEYVTGVAHSEEIAYFLDELRGLAQTHHSIIIGGSYPVKDEESGQFRNFSPLIDSSGRMIGGHFKMQLFRFERRQRFLQGHRVTTWKVDGLKIGQLICSDMWHPNLVMKLRGVDVLCVPIMTSVPHYNQTAYARWSWYCLAATRAKENVIPIVVSDSANGQWSEEYWTSGASSINDPSYRFLPEEGPHSRAQVVIKDGREGWIDLYLDLAEVEEYRRYRKEAGLL